MKRRDFLRGAGAIGGACLFSQLGALRALADDTGGYKALVCIFLAGGNDSNNTVVPLDGTAYSQYGKARGGLTLPKDKLAKLALPDGSTPYGLHPSLSSLVPAWDEGQLALLFNVGTLERPLSVAEYRTGGDSSVRIPGLFSHADQVRQWQASIAGKATGTGWGGRLMDEIDGVAGGMPGLISVAGASRFGVGVRSEAMVVPSSGLMELHGVDNTPASQARLAAWMQLHDIDKESQLVASAQDVSGFTLEKRDTINAALSASAPITKAAFTGLTTGIAKQLTATSRLIEQRHSHGTQRQVFFCSLGGFDLHAAQLTTHASLLRQLGDALAAFNKAMNRMGAGSQVTAFTHSEFSRTLHVNTTNGTDHAWGGHHFILGGAVQGRTCYGSFPDLRVAGPSDADRLGRWVPTTSVDQYAATLAGWFGVGPQRLSTVLPNLKNFAQPTLPFLRG
ncbi:DUF1501 domain-containing protein [Povalibacter sp.]|uniref:DUF1501 domain-containing protein n=1 Tax=Povalibacter sp. TaxID=1962978 RepID=UPI002F3E72EE